MVDRWGWNAAVTGWVAVTAFALMICFRYRRMSVKV